MTVASRKTVRDALSTALETAYGSAIAAIYPYMKTAFEGTSPVVRILNDGSNRPMRAGHIPQPLGSKFRYIVQHFVLFKEQGESDEQAAAEDKVDELESTLSQFIADNNQVPGSWKMIQQVDFSDTVLVKIGGYQYILEVFSIEVTVDG